MDYQPYQPYQPQQPYGGQPIPQKANPFAIASMVFGILSVLAIITGIFSLVFGSLSIIFVILSRRKNTPLSGAALAGSITSFVGILLSIFMLIISFALLPTLMKNPEYRNQLNSVSESMYGISFDEMMKDSYGLDLDSLFETK